jgi:hypothetical protein
VFRIACRVCPRRGPYRLARLAAKHRPETSLRDVLDRFFQTSVESAKAHFLLSPPNLPVSAAPQHSTRFTASPPRLVALYFDCMSAPHGDDDAVERDAVEPVAVQRERGGRDRLDRADGVALADPDR